MGWTRGSLALPRMNAHRLVISAAALTTMVAAALATALATFSGQGLPGAVRHDLSGASGTSIVISGAVNAGQVAQYTAQLPGQISRALHGTPYAFYRARWSDPLGFVPDGLMDDPEQTKAGLRDAYRRLLELDFDVLLLAHGDPVVGEAKQALRDFVDRAS